MYVLTDNGARHTEKNEYEMEWRESSGEHIKMETREKV